LNPTPTPPVPQGLVNIAVTPFGADGILDVPALSEHLDRILAAGYEGVLIGGTYGEFATMTADERLALFEAAVGRVDGRVPLLLCAAAADAPTARRLTRAAHDMGGYPMVTPPFVSEVTEAQIEAFFRDLAERCSDRIFVYNAPGVGITLPVALIERLAAIPGVIGLKQGDLSPTVVDRLAGRLGGRMRLFAASDLAIAGPAGAGFDGLSSTNSCAFPELIAAIHRAFIRGDPAQGRALNALWFGYRELARAFGQPQTVKAAMQLRGWIGGHVRAPLRDLDAGQLDALRPVVASIVTATKQLRVPARGASSEDRTCKR
jgi:4-hydroxy-tetrahydrodipicolinate synthase